MVGRAFIYIYSPQSILFYSFSPAIILTNCIVQQERLETVDLMLSFFPPNSKTSYHTPVSLGYSASKMFGSDIEKAAGAGVQQNLRQPNQAHLNNHDTFLPAYEEVLNQKLREFGKPEQQINVQAFDHIQEPKRGRRVCMKREWLIIITLLVIIFCIAMPVAVVLVLKNSNSSDKVSAVSNSIINIQYMAEANLTASQITIVQTRSPPMSFVFSPSTSTELATLTATVVAPSIVYVTVAPTPSTSTIIPSTVYVTVTPSSTTSISIPTMTLTTTLSRSDATTVSFTQETIATATMLRVSVLTKLDPTTVTNTLQTTKFITSVGAAPTTIKTSEEKTTTKEPVPKSSTTHTATPTLPMSDTKARAGGPVQVATGGFLFCGPLGMAAC